jgi:hypothetical protein
MTAPPYPLLNVSIDRHHLTNFAMSAASTIAAQDISTASATDPLHIPALQCYAAPYGIFGVFLHLDLYYCIFINKWRFSFIDNLFPQRQYRGSGYQNHKLNTFFCLLFGIPGFVITSAAGITCPTSGIFGYFIVSAVLPLTVGILLVKCSWMHAERGAGTAHNAKTGEVAAATVLVYIVACGFGVKDVASLLDLAGMTIHG